MSYSALFALGGDDQFRFLPAQGAQTLSLRYGKKAEWSFNNREFPSEFRKLRRAYYREGCPQHYSEIQKRGRAPWGTLLMSGSKA